jgi:pSer/pThr/pTyr-binding forkhead associated (FHA) protein
MQQDQDATMIGGPEAAGNSDRTRAMAPAGLDTTQMGASVECPVCRARNISADTYCCECGFLLSATPEDGDAGPQAPAAVLRDTRSGRAFPLEEGVATVGRENADILLSDPSVSRKHAEVEFRGADALVTDAGSTNGTVVNGRRIAAGEQQALEPGQEVRFGNCIFVLDLTRADDGQDIAAPPAEEPEEAGQPEEAEVTMVGSPESLPEFDLDLPDEQPAEAAAPSGPRLQDASNPALAYPISPEGAAIGRRSGQDIVIENPYVSSSHAAIAVQDGEYTLTDIGSTNGTVVNGETLPPNEPRVLADGDEISFGPVKLVFRKGEAEAI